MHVAERAGDVKATLLHRGEVRAARQECDVLSSGRELGAEISADATGSEDRDLHNLTASRLTTGTSPITDALWMVPRGISIHSPGPSTFMWPRTTRRKRPESTASILSTSCL